MLRPLAIGIPLIIVIALAFAAGMALVPPQSPYFIWVIIGYAVLFPLTLVTTIIAVVRSVRRAMAGGDVRLKQTGRQARAKVIESRRSAMTMRVSGSRPMSVWRVKLGVEEIDGVREHVVQRAIPEWQAGPRPGDAVTVYVDRARPSRMFIDWPQSEARVVQAGEINLDAFSPELANLVRKGLQMAEGLKPAAEALRHGVSVGGAGLSMSDSQATSPAPPSSPAAREEGRARIEALQPNPDGTYELDLFVSPKARDSYRTAVVAPVPHEKIGSIRKGQYLDVTLDPADKASVEIIWR